eukprot:TRINITY_DN3499_c6_g2_i1.p3 TRINITY_DN3499_c6_g2~~TRINITY_DN3499_c6_g2_i1.p3  ORF type:complete len:194 (+),score=87.57 TRINITY_DN3499_c6_g2_i1:80-583(+)
MAAPRDSATATLEESVNRAAAVAGWDSPTAASRGEEPKEKGAKQARKYQGAAGGRALPDDFEVSSDEGDADEARRSRRREEGAAQEEGDDGDDGGALEFLAEVTQYAGIDAKVDKDQAAAAGLTETEYQDRRVKAEERICEQHAREDLAEHEQQAAADAAFAESQGS